jgi:transposase-like protein
MVKKQSTKTGRSQWERELEKESFWRKKIADWSNSGQTIRSFARSNGISEHLFYAWRRELKIRDRESKASAAASSTPDAHENTAGRVADARGRLVLLKFKDTKIGGGRKGPFVPLTLLTDGDAIVEPQSVSGLPVEQPVAGPGIEISLPGRSIIHITKDTDLVLLSQILAALEVK